MSIIKIMAVIAMAEAGRRTAQDHYCASRIIPVYEQYYDRVLARSEV